MKLIRDMLFANGMALITHTQQAFELVLYDLQRFRAHYQPSEDQRSWTEYRYITSHHH